MLAVNGDRQWSQLREPVLRKVGRSGLGRSDLLNVCTASLDPCSVTGSSILSISKNPREEGLCERMKSTVALSHCFL